jgi:hypothetical protein
MKTLNCKFLARIGEQDGQISLLHVKVVVWYDCNHFAKELPTNQIQIEDL